MSDGTQQDGRFGFWLGLLLGLGGIALGPVLCGDALSPPAVRVLAVTAWMGVWWVTEAVPLGATALIPAAVFPLLSVAKAKEVAPAYASPFILLLMGAFFLAAAVEHSGVHRRLALHVLLRVGASPRRLVFGFAGTAAVLSMWLSNTATTLILLPIAMALAERAQRTEADGQKPAGGFATALLLALGYGASVGGMGTPVGTPPNAIALGVLSETFPGLDPSALGFLTWMRRAVPVVLLIVPVIVLVLVHLFPRVPAKLELGAEQVLRDELARLGGWRSEERRALLVFALAALLWVTRSDMRVGDAVWAGWASRFGLSGYVHDGTIAILAALLAFACPSGRGRARLLPWPVALRIPWGLVLLFGGGVALSRGFVATGLSEVLGRALSAWAAGSVAWLLLASTFLAVFGTEVISNTALATILMPILASTAKVSGADPIALLMPAAMACSCAFMMPAATGPNAIVFGAGGFAIRDMARAGALINLAAWGIVYALGLLIL